MEGKRGGRGGVRGQCMTEEEGGEESEQEGETKERREGRWE